MEKTKRRNIAGDTKEKSTESLAGFGGLPTTQGNRYCVALSLNAARTRLSTRTPAIAIPRPLFRRRQLLKRRRLNKLNVVSLVPGTTSIGLASVTNAGRIVKVLANQLSRRWNAAD